jgi:hypothetical protein
MASSRFRPARAPHQRAPFRNIAGGDIPRWGHERAPGDSGDFLVAYSDGLP